MYEIYTNGHGELVISSATSDLYALIHEESGVYSHIELIGDDVVSPPKYYNNAIEAVSAAVKRLAELETAMEESK